MQQAAGAKKPIEKPKRNKTDRDGDQNRRVLGDLTVRTDANVTSRKNLGKKDSKTKSKKIPDKTAELIALAVEYPEEYKRCIINVDDKGIVYAKVTDTNKQSRITRIHIPVSRTKNHVHCFADDEVVVKILNKQIEASANDDDDDDDDDTHDAGNDGSPKGEVIGILHHAYDLDNWNILCTADENNTDLLRPIDRALPTLTNYKNKDCEGKQGYVAIFRYFDRKRIDFKEYLPVVYNAPVPKIFVVRYLWWKGPVPLGVVVGVLPDEEPLTRSMRFLRIESRNPENFNKNVQSEIEDCFPEDFEIRRVELSRRLNFTDAMTFTIDPPDSKDFDDALSVAELADGKHCIGVHIADVAYFVKPKTALDRESRKRGTSIYEVGGKEPISMLPLRLSSDLCSLQEGKNRLTLSVFMTTDENDDIVSIELKKSFIKSKFRLNYEQVQSIFVKSQSSSVSKLPDELQKVLFLLNRISQRWRKQRVGHIEFSRQTNNLDYVLTPIAHRIVEEMMIAANHQVARVLLEQFPDCTPLVVHKVPDKPEIAEWRQRFRNEAAIIEMVQPFYDKDNLGLDDVVIDVNKKFVLHKQVWREMAQRMQNGELERLQSLILSPEYHPGLIVAWFNLPSFTKRSTYVCSGDHTPENRRHFSLNLPCYTQFTSPIRRYVDIAVHRLVHLHIDGLQETPCYSRSEISELCSENQSIKVKVGIYESNTKNMHFAAFLNVKPLAIDVLVERATSTGFKLNCLQLSAYLKLWPINVSHLGAKNVTAVRNHRRGKVILTYKLRIYDLDSSGSTVIQSSRDHENPVKLTSRRNIFYVSITAWKELVSSALENNRGKIMSSMGEIANNLEDPEKVISSGFNEDISCEGPMLKSGKFAVDFTAAVTSGDIIKVQVAGEPVRGKLNPYVQLLSLSPTVDICLEHRMNPGKCFAQVLAIHHHPDQNIIEEYCRFWSSLVILEASMDTVARGNCFLVQNVSVSWQTSTTGSFQIPVDFCRARGISDFEELVEEQDSDKNLAGSGFLGLICLRFHGALKQPPATELPIGNVIDLNASFTWVAHCVAVKISKTGNVFTILFGLNQSSTSMPDQIYRNFESHKTSVEWISVAESQRNTVRALQRLSKMPSTSFAASFAVSPPRPLEFKNANREHFAIVQKNLDKIKSKMRGGCFNKEQGSLILNALLQPFSLIHGLTCSGKTLMAAQLAYRIALINKLNQENHRRRGQVMCCGPTESCLLSMAELLDGTKLGLGVVMIFDQHEERKDYPLPADSCLMSRSLIEKDDGLKGLLGLHHLVHKTNSPSGEFIRQIDEAIVTQPMNVNDADLLRYKAVLEEEESRIIENADVILCLCATSVEKRIQRNAYIRQVIIDDSQSCSEVETLLPLMNDSVSQVILFGDARQVKPVVISPAARKYGLGHSLFERCLSDETVLITKQYSMHQELLNLLSAVFYDEKASKRSPTTGRSESCLDIWPRGKGKPFVFLDISGTETQSPAVSDGAALDVFNMDEVNAVVQICKYIVQKISSEENIAVLSFYKMQCAKIRKQLEGQINVSVATVNSAIGKHWNYAIISTVRSLPLSDIKQKPDKKWLHSNLGCLCSKNICCTLLSRAYDGLIILGNKTLLECDGSWKQLIQYCQKCCCVEDCTEFVANRLK